MKGISLPNVKKNVYIVIDILYGICTNFYIYSSTIILEVPKIQAFPKSMETARKNDYIL